MRVVELVMQWWAEIDGNSPAYDEQSADRVDAFTEAGDHVFTLYRYGTSGRWVNVRPEDVGADTPLWSDVDTYAVDPDGANLGPVYSLKRNELSGTVHVFRDGERIGHLWPDPKSEGFAAFRVDSSKPIARPKTERTCVLKITKGEWDGGDQL